MHPRRFPLGRSLLTLCGISLVFLLSSCSYLGSSDDESEDSDTVASSGTGVLTIDPDAPQIDLIAPGTVIGNDAPKGWTHLIVKSKPKMEYGDVNKVPDQIRTLSGLFFTAMLARVEKKDDGYELDDVAINLGTAIGDKDTIVTPDTQKKLGAGLGMLARIALEHGYDRFKDVRIPARTKTMAVVDGPAMMLRDEKHEPMVAPPRGPR